MVQAECGQSHAHPQTHKVIDITDQSSYLMLDRRGVTMSDQQPCTWTTVSSCLTPCFTMYDHTKVSFSVASFSDVVCLISQPMGLVPYIRTLRKGWQEKATTSWQSKSTARFNAVISNYFLWNIWTAYWFCTPKFCTMGSTTHAQLELIYYPAKQLENAWENGPVNSAQKCILSGQVMVKI